MGHDSKDCKLEKGKSDRNYTESTVKVGMVPQQIEEKTRGNAFQEMHDVARYMELAETTEAAATDDTANRQQEATHVSPGPHIAGTFPVTRSGRVIRESSRYRDFIKQ